jgi:hypothetical protein
LDVERFWFQAVMASHAGYLEAARELLVARQWFAWTA